VRPSFRRSFLSLQARFRRQSNFSIRLRPPLLQHDHFVELRDVRGEALRRAVNLRKIEEAGKRRNQPDR
jgi:hypothetical protein